MVNLVGGVYLLRKAIRTVAVMPVIAPRLRQVVLRGDDLNCIYVNFLSEYRPPATLVYWTRLNLFGLGVRRHFTS